MIHTRICDLFGIDHPIISAPMAGAATAELAAAVSEAGGLGLIGGTMGNNPDWLRAQIRAVRNLTQKPFGVGFISSVPGLDRLVQVAIEERVPVISHSFADPTPYVAAAHAAGIKVIVQVQKVSHAKIAALAGVDVVAAQGTEAGGHTGYTGTLALVPAVIDVMGGIPVVAAGGIADGRGLAAVLMLGAEGAWLGSRFVASREAITEDWKKQRAVQAGTDDTILTKVYDLISDAPFPKDVGDRVLTNDFTAAWHGQDKEVMARRKELQEEWHTADQAGDVQISRVQVGSATGLISSIEPAGNILRQIVAEAEAILRSRPEVLLSVGDDQGNNPLRKIKALGEIALRVSDLERMQEFYAKVVGLELLQRFPEIAFFRIADGYAGHTQILALFDRKNQAGYQGLSAVLTTVDHFAFTIALSDYQAEKARLESLGLAVRTAEHAWTHWRSLYISDPEGNVVEWVCYDPSIA